MRRPAALVLSLVAITFPTFLGSPALFGQSFIRGDANGDGNSNLTDSVYLTSYLFSGGPAPSVVDAGDVNDNGAVETSDIAYLLTFVFLGGPFPPPPFPFAGPDPTPNNFAPPVDPAYGVALGDSTTVVGEIGLELPLTLTNLTPVEALEVLLTFDESSVVVEDWSLAGSVLGGANTEFINFDFSNAPGASYAWFAAVVDFATPIDGHTLPAGVNQLVAKLVVSIPLSASFPQTTTIAFSDGILDPPLYTVLSVDGGDTISPARDDGEIDILLAFVRGDANRDGIVNLADSIFVVNYIFLQGTVPPCMDAADANNDGVVNIADTIYLLNYLFVEGPVPSEPFPDPGFDPDEDELGCDA